MYSEKVLDKKTIVKGCTIRNVKGGGDQKQKKKSCKKKF